MIEGIVHADCIEWMRKHLADGCVDAVITDPPYGTTACPWDAVVPFDEMWRELHRVAKPSAPFVMFGSQPFTTKLIASNIDEFREELVWLKNKSGSGMRAESRHLKVHENIIVFSREGKYTYNPQKWRVEDTTMMTHRKTMTEHGGGNNVYGRFTRTRKEDDGVRFPFSVLSYKIPMTPAKSKVYNYETDVGLHPTQKPLKLMEYLVRTYSDVGGIVLDPFCGSGTTAVACLRADRSFIAIEKDAKYAQMAKERIEKIRQNGFQKELFEG